VEGKRDALGGARAYINLDMASMGPNLGASASSSLKGIVANASGLERAKVGTIGAGSDHIGFAFHAGVPSIGLGASGAPGTAYHSNYDTTAWYRKSVGEDYASASTVSRATLQIAAAISEASICPTSASDLVEDVQHACAPMVKAGESSTDPLVLARAEAAKRVQARFALLREVAAEFDRCSAVASEAPRPSQEACARLDAAARAIDRTMLDVRGIPGRPWYRNLLLASDKDSGYAVTALPGLAEAETPSDALSAADALCARADALGEVLLGAAGPPSAKGETLGQ
jgi:N-acetylated-alpha-linked acidic dipeptidase